STISYLLLVVALLSGPLAIAREIQLMYAPAKAEQKRAFWSLVRIAFVLAAVLLYFDEHSKVAQLTKELNPPIQGCLSSGARVAIESLTEFKGQAITVIWSLGNDQDESCAQEYVDALRRAGWEAKSNHQLSTGICRGVIVAPTNAS